MKYFKYIILAGIVSTIFACDDEFLNPLPESAIVVDAFFASDSDVLPDLWAFMTLCKVPMRTPIQVLFPQIEESNLKYMLSEMRSDNTRTATLEGTKADFHRYRVDPNNIQSEDYYQSMYDIFSEPTIS